MASSNSTTTSTPSSQIYTCKWGRIDIFTGDNYAGFSATYELAFSVANCSGIVSGTEPSPASGPELDSWLERARRGVQIISNSVDRKYLDKIKPMANPPNPKGMWEELKKMDPASDPVYVSNLRTAFYTTTFDPSKEKIRDYFNRLKHFKTLLKITKLKLLDREIL